MESKTEKLLNGWNINGYPVFDKKAKRLLAVLGETVKDSSHIDYVVGSPIDIPTLKIRVANSEITFEGKKNIMLTEMATLYFKIEAFLKQEGYHI